MTPFPLFNKVSLTGAEDSVDPQELAALSESYPFAEWALLAHFEREGEGRNPSEAWRLRCLDALKEPSRAALHLCGKIAFERLLNEGPWPELSRYGRIQANVNARSSDFSQDRLLRIWEILAGLEPQLIIQAHAQTESLAKSFVRSSKGLACAVLFDESKGRGQRPDIWRPRWPEVSCGYAGGLGPEHLEALLPALAAAASEASGPACWIDMETSLRTDGLFDLAKARRVLEISAPWMIAPTPPAR